MGLRRPAEPRVLYPDALLLPRGRRLHRHRDLHGRQGRTRGSGTDIAALRDIVSAQAQRYLRAESPSPVSVQRNTVLRACLEKGAHDPQGLYTLTVPTGGGKTLPPSPFALEHAAAQKMKRVIYVIPYMSIIDQTAAVFGPVGRRKCSGRLLQRRVQDC